MAPAHNDRRTFLKLLLASTIVPVRPWAQQAIDVRGDGFHVHPGGSIQEALEAASRMEELDLVVTDVMMPQMTGDELGRRLRAQRPSVKVLYLTGFSDRLFKEKVTLWADEAFLDKPCTVKGLLEAVALLLFGSFDAPQDSAS